MSSVSTYRHRRTAWCRLSKLTVPSCQIFFSQDLRTAARSLSTLRVSSRHSASRQGSQLILLHLSQRRPHCAGFACARVTFSSMDMFPIVTVSQLHFARQALSIAGHVTLGNFSGHFLRPAFSFAGDVVLRSFNWQLPIVCAQLLARRANKDIFWTTTSRTRGGLLYLLRPRVYMLQIVSLLVPSKVMVEPPMGNEHRLCFKSLVAVTTIEG